MGREDDAIPFKIPYVFSNLTLSGGENMLRYLNEVNEDQNTNPFISKKELENTFEEGSKFISDSANKSVPLLEKRVDGVGEALRDLKAQVIKFDQDYEEKYEGMSALKLASSTAGGP